MVGALVIVPAPPPVLAYVTATSFLVEASSTDFPAGTSINVTVTAKDGAGGTGNTVLTFDGMVELSSSDPQFAAPAPHQYTGGDAGVYKFTGVVLKTKTTTGWIQADDVLWETGTGQQTGITVTVLPLHHVATDPPSGTVRVGLTIDFSAIGQDLYNNAVEPPITPASVQWACDPAAGSINATGAFTAVTTIGIYTDNISVSANQTHPTAGLLSATGTSEVVIADDVADIRLVAATPGALDDLVVNDIIAMDIQIEPNGMPIDTVDACINFVDAFFDLVDSGGTAIALTDPAVTANTSLYEVPLANEYVSSGKINFGRGSYVNRPTTTFTMGTVYFKAMAGSAGQTMPFSFNTVPTRVTRLVYDGSAWTDETPSTMVTVYTTLAADFTPATTQNISVGDNVTFTDTSTGPPTSWLWDFGDGGTSTEQNPSHKYTEVGTYAVSLTATNFLNSDVETKPGLVVVQPGTLHHLTVTGDNTTMTAGTGNQLTISAYDEGDNLLDSGTNAYTDNHTLIFSGPAASPYGDVPTVTDNTGAEIDIGTETVVNFTDGVSTLGGVLTAYNAETVEVEVTDVATGMSSTADAAWDLDLTVNPTDASHLEITGTGTMTTGSGNQLTITAYDQYGNTATGYTGDQSLTFSGPTASPYGDVATVTDKDATAVDVGTATTVTFTDGVSTAGGLLKAYKVEAIEVEAVDANVSTINSTADGAWDLNLSVTVSDASDLKVSGAPAMTAGDAGNQLTITAYDPYGNLATGYDGDQSLIFSGPGESPDLTAPTVTDKDTTAVDVGTATTITFTSGASTAGGLLKAYKAQTTTVDVSDDVNSIDSTANATWDLDLVVDAAALTTVRIDQDTYEVALLSEYTFTCTANDTYLNPIPYEEYSRTWFSDDGTAGNFTDSVNGIFVASGYLGTYTDAIRVVADGQSDTANITVIVGVTLQIMGTDNETAIASPVTAGTPLTITVSAIESGTAKIDYDGTIKFTSQDPLFNYTLVSPSLPYTFQPGDNGQKQFTNVILKTAGASLMKVTATDTVTTSITGTSDNITVNPAAANKLVYNPAPTSPVTAGATLTEFKVEIQDQYGNLRTANTNAVTVAPSTGTFASGAASKAAVGGVATFDDLTYTSAVTVTITASATGLAPATSSSIVVNPATAANLRVTGTATMTAGGSNELTVTAYDEYGNVCNSGPNVYDGAHALTFSGPSASPYSDTPTVSGTPIGASDPFTFTAGATAAGDAPLVAYKAETTTVDVNDGSINSTGNAAWDLDLIVSPASASHLKVTGTATMTAGGSNELKVTAYDQYGNTATGYIGTKSLTFSGPNNIGSYTPKVEGTAIGTARSFTFTIGATATNAATLVAYKVETPEVEVYDHPNSINSTADAAYDLDLTVNVAAANKLAYKTAPETSVVEGVEWTTFEVEIRDLYGNPRTADTNVVTVAASTGTLGGTPSQAAISGVATFDDITYPTATPITPITVTASATGLTSVTSASISVTPVITKEIELGTGWNIFSTPFALRTYYKTWGELDKIAVGGLDVDPDSQVVYTYDASATSPWVAISSTTVVKPLDAYYVKLANADNISLIADTEVGATYSLRSKTLPANWNLVGLGYCYPYLPTPAGADADGLDAQTALADVEYIGGDTAVHGYSRVQSPGYNDTGWVYFWGETPRVKSVGDFMYTGKGYWVFMEAADTLGAFTQTPLVTGP
ncbi:PKD domain-containing protein, partial [Chloroflexota bacterium]